jgi:hypothetical protein
MSHFARIAIASALLATAARAEEPPAAVASEEEPSRRTYPASRVERPLLLPPLVFEPQIGVGVTNVDNGGNGETLSFGVDAGVVKRLQLGLFFDFPLDPNADFGTFLFDVQLGLHKMVNLRFDVGAERFSVRLGQLGGTTKDGFVAAVGVPVKIKLHRMLAFVSSDSSARGFGPQPLQASKDGKTSAYGAGVIFSNDLVALWVADTGSAGIGSTSLFGALMLPVGFIFQPHDRISFGVRSGYRLAFFHTFGDGAPSRTPLVHYVPLALDLVVNPIRQLDLGFTAFLFGFVGSQNLLPSGASGPGWADLRQFNFWVAGRI